MSFPDAILKSANTATRDWTLPDSPRAAFFGLTVGLASVITLAFAASVTSWTLAALVALPLVAVNALWIAGGAATAIVGVKRRASRLPGDPPAEWQPVGKTAIIVTLCKEPPHPVARYLRDLHASLRRHRLEQATRIFVLSDTQGEDLITREEAALRGLIDAGLVEYRRRERNIGRKPGNIADWLRQSGDAFDYMLVLDADSRMSAGRIRRMIRQIESRPRAGLVQAGMGLVPGGSRFARHQRSAVRLMSSNFGHGMAAWAGRSGNYWGHNAIIRTKAFREAAALPELSGRPPFGGPILSHDFIEAAWIRRAGWAVELDPDLAGSAEAAPQTLEAFHKRDRRWCQGNLQHMRVLAEPGLHPMSRFHLVSGVLSYLAAPIWLSLVVLVAAGAVQITGALPFLLVALVLLLPKVCALWTRMPRAGTLWRKWVTLRAWAGELAVSSLVAPIMMVRQTASVLSVLMGRDCGWKSGRMPRFTVPRGLPEIGFGLALMATASHSGAGMTLWLSPLILPLLGAPFIVRVLDASAQ